MNLLSDFAALFFPRCCAACSRALVGGETILCTHCVVDLPKTDYHHSNDNPVEQKFAGRLPIQRGAAFLKFRKGGMVQHLLHQLKYSNQPEVGVVLGKLYGRELLQAGWTDQLDFIIPVPLHASRKRKRGYNQSSKLAEGLSCSLQIPWDESISLRALKTVTQTTKSKSERWENVKDVFTTSGKANVTGKRILLVDDVITTGATLEACGRHLIDEGCAELSIACLAEAQ
jgi:ComF family protein